MPTEKRQMIKLMRSVTVLSRYNNILSQAQFTELRLRFLRFPVRWQAMKTAVIRLISGTMIGDCSSITVVTAVSVYYLNSFSTLDITRGQKNNIERTGKGFLNSQYCQALRRVQEFHRRLEYVKKTPSNDLYFISAKWQKELHLI